MAINCNHTSFNPLARTIVSILNPRAFRQKLSACDKALENVRQETKQGFKDEIRLMMKASWAQLNIEAGDADEGAIAFISDHQWDRYPDNYPQWDMLPDLFDQIRAFPGSAHGFRALLHGAALYRAEMTNCALNPNVDFLEEKLYGMVKLIVGRATEELAAYEAKVKDAVRPADTFRAYGIALRYAVENLGSIAARRILAKLMMATPLPVDELENPDWIDPYTGCNDPDYSYLKVKEANEVSSDGNMPALIADMLGSMGEEEAQAFQDMLKKNNSSLDDYWMQFKEAQRSGYSEVAEPEEEAEGIGAVLGEDAEHTKDSVFDFQNDLKVNYEEVEEIKNEISEGLIEAIRSQVNDIAAKSQAAREAGEKFDYNGAHQKFLEDDSTVMFFNILRRCARHYNPANIMAILLPFQNTYGIWEEDLYQIRLPKGCITLAHWYAINGEEFLEPFINKEGVDYGDPAVNKKYGNRYVKQNEPSPADLDELTWQVVFEQTELYQKSEERRVEWNTKTQHKYKTDVRWHPAFIAAEVQTAVMGTGGIQSAQAAGWNAWRESIDPEANKEYGRLRRAGKPHAEANARFWEVVKANRNKIASLWRGGIILRSGRKIDWGITLTKLKSNEIPLAPGELERLLTKMQDNGIGTAALRIYLQQRIETAKKIDQITQ